MRRRALLPLAFVSVAFLAAGCGGSNNNEGGNQGGGEATATATPTATGTGGGGEESQARDLFAANCGSCHTLAAADTNGTFGPNLDDAKPSKKTVLAAIKSGPGAMPPNLVEGADAETVATYVADNAGQ